jgi:hypothetical protein
MAPENWAFALGSAVLYAAIVKQMEFTMIDNEVILYDICLCKTTAQKHEKDIVRTCKAGRVVGELHRYTDSPSLQSPYSVHAIRCKPMPKEKDKTASCKMTRLNLNITEDFSIWLEHHAFLFSCLGIGSLRFVWAEYGPCVDGEAE